MSEKPFLSASGGSYPVLFPGVDSLNHGRGQPVSWIIAPLAPTDPSPDLGQRLGLSLSIHLSTGPGEELLNNYGAKPNSELILGYGFSLEGNPDDTIVLSINGGPTGSEEKERWEVGRNARGIDGVWNYVLNVISSTPLLEEEEEEEQGPEATRFENQLEASNTLLEMCQAYLDRLPKIPAALTESPQGLRPEVLTMFGHYIEGAGHLHVTAIYLG